MIDSVERFEECWTIAHDFLEVVLRAQFLPEINVFLLQPSLHTGRLHRTDDLTSANVPDAISAIRLRAGRVLWTIDATADSELVWREGMLITLI